MAHSDTGICYECDAECVGAVFCGNGGQDSPDVRLPKVLNVAIEANPAFWGFGGILFSGDITYSSSKFDYWNNFEENWLVDKTCGNTTIRDLDNETRPDVKYRSVYDPDTGTITYDGNTEIDELGGPSVYLIDRDATKFTDAASCDETDPNDVFRHHPENFGFGNKILFEEDIYKNISAAWRGADTGVPNFTFNEGGLPDGAVVGQYTGNVTSVYRDTATDPFIHLRVQYTGGQASAIRNGQILHLNSTCANQAYESQYLPDGAYYLTKVTHNGSYTDCALVGSVGTEDFSESLTSSTWTIAGSLDEQTCRSRRAHGVDYENKCAELDYNYHADLGVVINDSRNRIHSNRKTRDKFGVSNIRSADDKPRRDYTYVSVQESGYGLLVKEEETDNVALVCETGIWHPTWDFIYTSGDDYYSAFKPEDLFSVSGYHSDAPSTLVNIGSGLILTCGCTSGEPLGLCDISTGCLPLGWSKYFVSNGVYPMYGRELPFYGPFYEVYEHDNAVRNWQQDNTIKARNQTCYTPLATLEVYPDCVTQQVEYRQCGGGYTHLINNVSRLAFVYRCFDYQEPCSYDESGRPYNGAPTDIDDLRRGLAGQEVYMFLNIGSAWAGEINRDPCGCNSPPPGNQPPNMMSIGSPVTFPCFLNWDDNPDDWGAQDQLWKRYASNFIGEEVPTTGCPGPLEGDYSFAQQPYTTYGFIRNVCGKETNLSKSVIQSLNSVNTGAYRNTTPENNTVEPMYWEFPIVEPTGSTGGWGGGLNSFVNDSGTLATWGIVDQNNRLVAPYFPYKSGEQLDICNPSTVVATYTEFDEVEAFKANWPKDNVPFLIRVIHNNNCVGCGTNNMSSNALEVTLTSLDTTYTHNSDNKYGFTHCGYNFDIAYEPTYTCESGFGLEPCDQSGIFADKYTDTTCACLDGVTIPLTRTVLEGTDIVKYISTTNPNNSENAFYPIRDCSFEPSLPVQDYFEADDGNVIPYVNISLSCGNPINSLYQVYYSDGLSEFYSCGDCSHSYPGVNNRSNISVEWILVAEKYAYLFDRLSTEQIYSIQSLLENGLQFTMVNGDICPSSPGDGSDPCSFDQNFVNARMGCCGSQSGVAFAVTNLPSCDGSRVIGYGCLLPGVDEPEPLSRSLAGGFFTGHLTSPIFGQCQVSTGSPCDIGDGSTDLYNTGCAITDNCGDSTYLIDGEELSVLPVNALCGCNCIGTFDPVYEYTYHSSSVCGSQWLSNVVNFPYAVNGVNDPTTATNADGGDGPVVYAVSGGGIPGFGDFGPIPLNEKMAKFLGGSRTVPACSWKTNVDQNAFTNVDYKINPPGKHSEVRNDSPCGELWPNYCDVQWTACPANGDVYRSTCLTPIYGDTSVRVRRKRAYPEIMTVHKIDCLGGGSGYNLHVSREYYNHSRAWYYPLDGYTCDTYKGAVRGGGYNWRRSYIGPGKGPCPSFYFHPCSGADLNEFTQVWPAVDTGDPNYNLEGPFPSYYLLPHSTPSDQVTPAYPTIDNSAISTSQSLCSYHPHSGSSPNHSVTRDFRYTTKPYNAKWEEYVQVFVSGDSGAVPQQLPLYTGVIDPPDTGVYGDYCDVISNTGELVNIWIPRGKVFLDSDIENALQDAESGVYTAEFGEFSCSGIGWAIAGPALKQYDYGNQIRYFAADALATSQCDTNQRYPDLSGVTLWNYYNLFYGSGDPDNRFYNYVELIIPDEEGDCNDPGRQSPPWNFSPVQGGPPNNTSDPHFGPIYDTSTDVPLNRRHSCIQDSTQCGGELWNNKMFFPRKPYEAGTRVTAFGALSLCTQDTTYETASWLEGYEDLSANGTPDILREAMQTRFIDACDTDAHSVILQSSVGIDDVIIHVSDYLPLLGMYFVDRKMNLGDYTCLQPDSGCYDFLPIHSDQTLDKMSFVPAKTWSNDKEVSFGYYLDKLVTDAQDQCLFKPFKIMVDVDCCPDTIRKVGQENDIYEPTYMSWISTDVPGLACQSLMGPIACNCFSTRCQNIVKPNVQVTWYQIVTYTECDPCFGGCPPDYSSSIRIIESGLPVDSGCNGEIASLKNPEDNGFAFTVTDSPEVAGKIYTGATYDPFACDGSGLCYAYDYQGTETFNIGAATNVGILGGGTVGGYRCGNNIYIPGYTNASHFLANSGTCEIGKDNLNVCQLLTNAFSVPLSGTLISLSSGHVNGNYGYVFHECECGQKTANSTATICDDTHNIMIEISEV